MKKVESLPTNITGKLTQPTFVAVPSDSAKLAQNLRHLDYDNLSALADIIDNSVDAKAQNIRFHVEQEQGKISALILSDDGSGMTLQTLINGFKMGSTNKSDAKYVVNTSATDLGKFGMGLKTASLSFCTKITVITRKNGKQTVKGTYSLENIQEYGEFVLKVENADKSDLNFFNIYTDNAKSGTVILFENLDRFNFKRKDALTRQMRFEYSRIYRHFLKNNTFNLFVDGVKVAAQDTLMENTPEELGQSDIIYDQAHTFNIKESDVNVRIKIAFLPDLSNKKVKAVLEDQYNIPAMNQQTQGFSVIRNNREIKFGEQIDKKVFYKDHWFDRFRAEIHFDPSVDGLFSLNFSKNNISNIDEDLKQSIVDVVYPHFRHIFNTTKKEKNEKKEAKSHAAAENFLSSMKDDLDLYQMKKEKEKLDKEEKEKKDRTPKNDDGVEKVERKKRAIFQGTFVEVHLGENAAFYIPSCDPTTGKMKIDINMDHAFYDQYTANEYTMETVDYMIFFMANAEYGLEDEKLAVAKDMREKVSANLSSLLSKTF